ncbi:MAG: phytanoyl-CoA dioxygenase family protein [Cephaloticoccus sp.]|nr:phytanoyl-CoA dioxygenase family protein [Cephaloticoccus sp.]MCF7759531.1 phytanoyl-CoA dioxygenase family protein [Cephaloticoccus sp.]
MEPTFDRPFPALTPAQRYHFDINGYVVVPKVLSEEECTGILSAMQRIKTEIRALTPGVEPGRGEPRFLVDLPHHVFISDMREADPLFSAYATHPRLVGMAEEVMGAEARMVEMNAHINSRKPEAMPSAEPKFDFHNGMDVPYASHSKNGLFHCSFVKTLTNLTELGPDDGGTVVVAGSHKIDLPVEDMIARAYEDRSLIHQVVAPAGSTLLFAETLIHATGQIRSDRERAIIICGYGSTMFPYWGGCDLTPEFTAKIPAQLQTLYLGKASWLRGPRYRNLTDPVDPRPFTLADGWHYGA